MKSSRHDPYRLGYTCATMVGTKSREHVSVKQIFKTYLSLDCNLKLVYMKLESLVIVYNYVTVKFIYSSTHRPSSGESMFDWTSKKN